MSYSVEVSDIAARDWHTVTIEAESVELVEGKDDTIIADGVKITFVGSVTEIVRK